MTVRAFLGGGYGRLRHPRACLNPGRKMKKLVMVATGFIRPKMFFSIFFRRRGRGGPGRRGDDDGRLNGCDGDERRSGGEGGGELHGYGG